MCIAPRGGTIRYRLVGTIVLSVTSITLHVLSAHPILFIPERLKRPKLSCTHKLELRNSNKGVVLFFLHFKYISCAVKCKAYESYDGFKDGWCTSETVSIRKMLVQV